MAARALVLEAAPQAGRGETVTLEAAAAKYFASEMVGRVADRAVQIFGGAGYVADYGIERFYRDVRIFRIYEGTSQIQQLVIARETIKAAADRNRLGGHDYEDMDARRGCGHSFVDVGARPGHCAARRGGAATIAPTSPLCSIISIAIRNSRAARCRPPRGWRASCARSATR